MSKRVLDFPKFDQDDAFDIIPASNGGVVLFMPFHQDWPSCSSCGIVSKREDDIVWELSPEGARFLCEAVMAVMEQRKPSRVVDKRVRLQKRRTKRFRSSLR